ncbi:hypothetical protein J5N97_022701 [Dioscorea zingiberensis]|uniref:Uncharacterized protein n=1 Tax=Dioscorea zingiberensis TaxID=325984 RepID=A0A9D5CB93_9LILI|nr:hypothetical protein J5N97_022701 [Dioscorea zingiberensis]
MLATSTSSSIMTVQLDATSFIIGIRLFVSAYHYVGFFPKVFAKITHRGLTIHLGIWAFLCLIPSHCDNGKGFSSCDNGDNLRCCASEASHGDVIFVFNKKTLEMKGLIKIDVAMQEDNGEAWDAFKVFAKITYRGLTIHLGIWAFHCLIPSHHNNEKGFSSYDNLGNLRYCTSEASHGDVIFVFDKRTLEMKGLVKIDVAMQEVESLLWF